MIGPPGAGKTLLARAIPGILPEMSLDAALDVTRIYWVSDALPPEIMVRTRPFRAPHRTISHAGLVGGGNWPHPGEISLARRGVLFLDELPEFGTRVLEVMRRPDHAEFVRAVDGDEVPEADLGAAAGPDRHPAEVPRAEHCTTYSATIWARRASRPAAAAMNYPAIWL